jgi:hypothetical protein
MSGLSTVFQGFVCLSPTFEFTRAQRKDGYVYVLKVAETTEDEVIARVEQWEDFYTVVVPVPPLYRESD